MRQPATRWRRLGSEPFLLRLTRPRRWPIVEERRIGDFVAARTEMHMNLRQKYDHAIQVAKGLRMQGAAEERDGKLHFHGVVNSDDEKNQIWNAIKTVATWQTEVVAELTVLPSAAPAARSATPGPAALPQTYTVKAGDTLSKIAKEHLGNANAYMDIFNANRDQLSDPDKIKPGQVLKLPVVST
jgi:nucleoid-associated protein YgaU